MKNAHIVVLLIVLTTKDLRHAATLGRSDDSGANRKMLEAPRTSAGWLPLRPAEFSTTSPRAVKNTPAVPPPTSPVSVSCTTLLSAEHACAAEHLFIERCCGPTLLSRLCLRFPEAAYTATPLPHREASQHHTLLSALRSLGTRRDINPFYYTPIPRGRRHY